MDQVQYKLLVLIPVHNFEPARIRSARIGSSFIGHIASPPKAACGLQYIRQRAG